MYPLNGDFRIHFEKKTNLSATSPLWARLALLVNLCNFARPICWESELEYFAEEEFQGVRSESQR